jgi:hypothetical protein
MDGDELVPDAAAMTQQARADEVSGVLMGLENNGMFASVSPLLSAVDPPRH